MANVAAGVPSNAPKVIVPLIDASCAYPSMNSLTSPMVIRPSNTQETAPAGLLDVPPAAGMRSPMVRSPARPAAGVEVPGKYQPCIRSSNSMPTPSGNCASRNGLSSVLAGSSLRVIRAPRGRRRGAGEIPTLHPLVEQHAHADGQLRVEERLQQRVGGQFPPRQPGGGVIEAELGVSLRAGLRKEQP